MLSAARAVLRGPAQPDLDQRAAHLYPRVRRRARAGEPDQPGRAPGVPRQGHPARSAQAPSRSPGPRSTTARSPTTTSSSRPGRRSWTTRSGDQNVYTTYDGTGGVPIESVVPEAPLRRPLRRVKILLLPGTSPPRAGSSTTVRSTSGSRRSPPSSGSTATPTWSITQGRPARLDHRRLHHLGALSLLRADRGLGNYIRNSVKAVVDAYHGTRRLLRRASRTIR